MSETDADKWEEIQATNVADAFRKTLAKLAKETAYPCVVHVYSGKAPWRGGTDYPFPIECPIPDDHLA